MSLVSLKTDLKNLKYGKDTLGGGYSGQPYIQTKIPEDFNDLGAREDFILRGGANAARDTITDIQRLTKMFFDLKSPNGVLFIAKQNLLSQTAVRTQTSGIINEGIYTPLNTLAQAGVIATGGHLNKQGLNPFAETGAYSNNNNLYGVKVKNDNAVGINRLLKIYDEKQVVKINAVNVLTYTGGPGAPLGIGNTNIRFADQRTGENNSVSVSNPNFFIGKNNQKSVNIEDKQVSGLQIEPAKPWIWGGPKIVTPSTTYNLGNFLPNFDVNKPQSGSLDKVPNGESTWTEKKSNPDSLKYYKTFYFSGNKGPINNTGISGKYFRLTSVSGSELYNNEGVLTGGYYNFNVYEPAKEGNTWPKNSPLIYNNNTFTYNQEDIINAGNNIGKLKGSPKIQDFRDILRSKLGLTLDGFKATDSGATTFSQNYNLEGGVNFTKRVNIGDPGQRAGKSYSNYTKGVTDLSTTREESPYTNYNNLDIGNSKEKAGLDRITSLPIYRSENVTTDSVKNDFVKFRIAVIDNDFPGFKTFIHFRAFLDSMSDSYNSTWNGFNYLGRGEQFYTYGGFTRTLSLSWTVAAQSKQELIPMYKKLNYLASSLAPDYSPGTSEGASNRYMRGNLVQLTVGGYVYEQPGFITALTYDVPSESPWEIGIGSNENGNEDGTVKELPHIIKVTGFSFTPIQRFIPQLQNNGFGSTNSISGSGFVNNYGPERYIALANGNNEKNNNYNVFDTNNSNRRN
jgi:hypothetical protein